MKTLIFSLLLVCSTLGFAQQNDKSPYLQVSTQGANIPLKKTKTDVHIAGTIAHVRITQVYQNQGDIPIEAKYVFPLSTQAAVHKMQMTVGDRIINAKIFEKQDAEKVYNKAVSEGKRAAKLDQERPNVFQMKVGNIMPGDEIAIDIYYTEMLVPVKGEYQFVAPGVVGPRFVGESSASEEVFNTPYTKKGISDTFDFDMHVTINAGIIIQNVSSSSHKINVKYPDATQAEVFLSKSNVNPANRDFILNYNLRGNEIQSGLLLYEHEDENFFAFLMEPMEKVEIKDLPVREYLFIVDVSGSMNGYPMEISRELMRNLLCNLQPDDTFNVQLFASSSTIFSSTPVFATTENIEHAINFLSNGQGGGGTQLLNALETVYNLPKKYPGTSRSMVVITDGYVSVEKEAFQLIKNNLNEANVFTFGIGSSVNRYLLEGMAKVSNSESFIATTKEEASKVAMDFKEYIDSPLLTHIKLKTKGFEIYDVAPSSIPDVFAARPVVVFGKYKGKAEGKIIVTGYNGKKKFRQEYTISKKNLDKNNTALRYLWARKKIAELDDYKTLFREDVKSEVTQLGLQYNLATQYTSFVAVDETPVNKTGNLKTVKQPLPMPANVENSAVGAAGEISETSKFVKTFSIDFSEDKFTKAEERQLKIWFKANYSKFTQDLLSKETKLKINFGKDGKIVSVEAFKNGKWIIDIEITKAFQGIKIKKVPLKSQFSIVVNK